MTLINLFSRVRVQFWLVFIRKLASVTRFIHWKLVPMLSRVLSQIRLSSILLSTKERKPPVLTDTHVSKCSTLIIARTSLAFNTVGNFSSKGILSMGYVIVWLNSSRDVILKIHQTFTLSVCLNTAYLYFEFSYIHMFLF